MESHWYHESISRHDAEQKLVDNGKDGSYLVRKSDTVPGAYVLSLFYSNRIHHYRIKSDTDGFYKTDGPSDVQQMSFTSLGSLIEYVAQNGEGLAGPLLYPVTEDVPDIHETEVEETSSEEELSSEDEDESDSNCPPEIKRSLKKRSTTKRTHPTLLMFQRYFESMNIEEMEEVDPEFVKLVRKYVNSSAWWDVESCIDDPARSCLEMLMEYSCRDLKAQLDKFVKKIELLDTLLSNVGRESNLEDGICTPMSPVNERDLDNLIPALATCSNRGAMFQEKMGTVFKSLNKSMRVTQDSVCRDDAMRRFDVKEGGLRAKTTIVVKPRQGVLSFGRSMECDQRQVKQLIKSLTAPTKMSVLFQDSKRKEIVFEDTRLREEFFQIVHQMKYAHQSDMDVSQISVYCCTWNMGELAPVDNLTPLFIEKAECVIGDTSHDAGIAHDIYAIGTQEADVTERDWVTLLKNTLKALHGVEYRHIAAQTLMGIRLVVLVKVEHFYRIAHIESSSVKTGVGGMVGNKGAVGVSFTFGATIFAFINCHLAARAERKAKRTEMYHNISKTLNLGKKHKFGSFDLPYRFHHLFWVGDLNYRLDCKYQEVLEKIKGRYYEGMLLYDQLVQEMEEGNIFLDFHEGEIKFPPTYRYKRGSRSDYIYIKEKTTGNVYNVPSYCDRILTHSFPEILHKQKSYACNVHFMGSDHAPVFATYDIGINMHHIVYRANESTREEYTTDTLKIRFACIEAKVKSKSIPNFYLKFFSYLLEGSPQSKRSTRTIASFSEEMDDKSFRVNQCQEFGLSSISRWGLDELPTLDPIVRNRDYIANEHILVQVRSHEGDESYGQCIINLKKVAKDDQLCVFQCFLTHHGDQCGEMRIKMGVSQNEVVQEPKVSFSDQLVQPWRKSPVIGGEHRLMSPTLESPTFTTQTSWSPSSPHGNWSPTSPPKTCRFSNHSES